MFLQKAIKREDTVSHRLMQSTNMITKSTNRGAVGKVFAVCPHLVSIAVADAVVKSDLGKKRLILPDGL